MKAFICFALVIAAVVAEDAYHPAPAYAKAAYPAYPDTPAKYEFAYEVQDAAAYLDFGHNEQRDNYNTAGYYHVALPDGRHQRVTYTVNGDEGYVADVKYEGEAHYPEAKPYAAAPAYPKASYPAPAPAPYHPKATYPAPAPAAYPTPAPAYPH